MRPSFFKIVLFYRLIHVSRYRGTDGVWPSGHIDLCVTSLPVRLVVFGRPEPLQVLARVVSQGPVIDIQPPSLDWGLVPVLTPHHKTVTISNQAPVPADVTAVMVRRPDRLC